MQNSEEGGEDRATLVFHQLCSTVCMNSRLGIFSMECGHRRNQISLASSHALRKDWVKMAAESFLADVKFTHNRLGSGESQYVYLL